MPVFQLSTDIFFPPPHLAEPEGLIAIGGDLSWERLIAAYRVGIFPWYSEGEPILWWTPSPRLVLFPTEFYLSKRLARTIRQKTFTVTVDKAFKQVINKCAAFRSNKRNETWITKDMITAYNNLHQMGYAHSVECWQEEKLVGGLYGIGLNRVFFGESMFSEANNSSKVALYYLVQIALNIGIELIDCQLRTEHLMSLGAREISREKFQRYLEKFISDACPQKKWRLPVTNKEEYGTADACQEVRRKINE